MDKEADDELVEKAELEMKQRKKLDKQHDRKRATEERALKAPVKVDTTGLPTHFEPDFTADESQRLKTTMKNAIIEVVQN